LNSNLPSAFGNYTGFVDVDALGRYMSGDGTTFAVVSSLNPSKVNLTFPSAPSGTIDAYHITTDFFGSTVVLATSKPGIPGSTVGGQVTAAIIPKDAPNTIVFSATLPSGSSLVPGYVNQNGNRAELYWRQIFGTEPQPAVLVSAAVGSTVRGANAGLDLSIGNFAVDGEGTKVYFTSPATNLVNIADTNNANDVFVRTIATGVTSAISVTGGAGASTGNAASSRPRPTNDGWLVGFESKATNIVTLIDTNLGSDIFVRNLVNNTTGIASASPDNVSTGDTPSSGPVVGGSKTNAVVFFNSEATNLDATYTFPGGRQNVFSVNAPIPASDATRILALSGGVNGFAGLARFDATGKLVSGPPIAPFPGFTGEVRIASADVNGDGVPDLIAGAGPGGGPRVRVLDGVTFQTIADIFAFEPTFTGGVYVAAGDFNKDGYAEIVIGAGEGGGPRVQVYDGKTITKVTDIFVFETSFRGGIRVSVGDFNGDGTLDLVTAAGEGGGPRVKVVDGAFLPNVIPLADFFAYEQTLRNGVYVGAGDINGDNKADIVTGAGPGGSPRVSVFDANTFLTIPAVNPDTARVIDYFAYDDRLRDGVRVAIKNADGDGNGDIVTGPGSGPPLIRVFSTGRFTEAKVPQQLSEQFAFDQPIGRLGAYVG
ncbi:MAG: VCBS repeat-containing protein, partial [Bacteroidales bacterium]|nr:VCBS repeat-containing protein [Bacteroidales bacterium]